MTAPMVWSWTAMNDGSINLETKPATELVNEITQRLGFSDDTKPVVMRGFGGLATIDQFFRPQLVWPAYRFQA